MFLWVSAQVDITKYASDDLFEVRPIISTSSPDESSNDPEDLLANNELKDGFEYWANGDYDDAIYFFQQKSDDRGGIAYLIGLIFFEKEQYDEAIEQFDLSLSKSPLFLEASYMKGMVLLEKEESKEAIKLFRTLTEVSEYQAYGYHGLAINNRNQGAYVAAIRNFRRSIESDPSFLEAYIPLAQLLLYYDSKKQARTIMDNAIEVNPEWEDGILVRGIISLYQGKGTDQFLADVDRLLELDPTNYHYISMKGFLEVELKQYQKAVNHFHLAYNLEGDTLRKGETKASSKFKKNESIQRSLDYYFDHFSLDENARRYLDRGICEFITGDRNRSLSLLDSALVFERNAVILNFKGAIHRTYRNESNLAIDAFSEAIKLDSMNWIAYSYRGEAYIAKKDLGKAYEDYSKVIKLKPKSKEGYKSRGIILNELGYYPNAYKDFSYGIAIDQTDYDLFFDRALTSFHLERYEQAVFDLMRIIENKENDHEAYQLLYQCKLALNDSAAALNYLDSASKHSKYNPSIHEDLIALSTELNDIERTLIAYNRLVKYSWKTEYRLKRAIFLVTQEEYEKAIDDLLLFIKRNKSSGKAYYYLALSYKETGNEDGYTKYMRKANKFGYSE